VRHQKAQFDYTRGSGGAFVDTVQHGAFSDVLGLLGASFAGMPVLLLHGDKDTVVPFSPSYERYVDALDKCGAAATHKVVQGAGHALFWEPQCFGECMRMAVDFAAGAEKEAENV
jgi:fermentation-respiration switch protein FrsA (DUF1100 family)